MDYGIWIYGTYIWVNGKLMVGGWPTPLKNMSSSVGMMKFQIYGKIKMFQTTNQWWMLWHVMTCCCAKSVSKASDSSGATSVPSFTALGDDDMIPSPRQRWHIVLSQLLHFSAKWRPQRQQELLDLQDFDPGVQVPWSNLKYHQVWPDGSLID